MENKYFWKVDLMAVAVIALSSCVTRIEKNQKSLFSLIHAGIFNAKINGIGD